MFNVCLVFIVKYACYYVQVKVCDNVTSSPAFIAHNSGREKVSRYTKSDL